MSLFANGSVHMSAKTEYAIRAMIELAGAGPDGSLTSHAIADAQRIPLRFLLNILSDLRRVGLVDSRRGPSGGWWLSKPAQQITVADVVRAADGPLVEIGGARPGQADDVTAATVSDLWITVRTGIRDILEQTTIADLSGGKAPAPPTS
jgi:Rrf2 family protein